MKRNPKEKDPKIREIIKKAEEEAEEILKDKPKIEGFCYMLWSEQKRILKEKYGIDWKSPDEMNPDIIFD